MKTSFELELEIFRKEEEEAQQHFFAYIGIRSLAATNPEILRTINKNAQFWITTQHALLVSAFIVLGRIFDPQSSHNLGRLVNALETDRSHFTRDA